MSEAVFDALRRLRSAANDCEAGHACRVWVHQDDLSDVCAFVESMLHDHDAAYETRLEGGRDETAPLADPSPPALLAVVRTAESPAPARVMLDEIAAHFCEVPEAIKVLKVTEEAGEAAEAYIGYIGANPRKGQTHDQRGVATELADVMLSAYVALSAFSGDPWEAFETRCAEIIDRLPKDAQLPENSVCLNPPCLSYKRCANCRGRNENA